MHISFIPKKIINKLHKDEYVQIQINIIMSTLFLVVFLLAINYLKISLYRIEHFCLFKKIFGIDCPGCGFSSSFFYLLNLQFKKSLLANFMGIPTIFLIITTLILRLLSIFKVKKRYIFNKYINLGNYLIIAGLLLNWIIKLTK